MTKYSGLSLEVSPLKMTRGTNSSHYSVRLSNPTTCWNKVSNYEYPVVNKDPIFPILSTNPVKSISSQMTISLVLCILRLILYLEASQLLIATPKHSSIARSSFWTRLPFDTFSPRFDTTLLEIPLGSCGTVFNWKQSLRRHHISATLTSCKMCG